MVVPSFTFNPGLCASSSHCLFIEISEVDFAIRTALLLLR